MEEKLLDDEVLEAINGGEVDPASYLVLMVQTKKFMEQNMSATFEEVYGYFVDLLKSEKYAYFQPSGDQLKIMYEAIKEMYIRNHPVG